MSRCRGFLKLTGFVKHVRVGKLHRSHKLTTLKWNFCSILEKSSSRISFIFEHSYVPSAGHILAQNLERHSSSSAAPIETIQPIGQRQNIRILFSCRTNRHPLAFTKLFTRTDESSRNIRWSYSLHALMRQNVGRNATSSSPYIKTFSNCYSVDISVSFKEKQHPFQFYLTWARGTQFGEGPVLAVHLAESVSPFARNVRPWQPTHLFHRSRLKHYSTIRLLTLRVKFDGISRRTPELEHLPWTAFIRCVWNIFSFHQSILRRNKMLLFWSLHFLSAFFHKISSNVSRNMLKIQTESYFHLTMSKWPISTAKL